MFDTLIVQPIFNLLLGLYALIPGGDFGVSLILFTILVRFALWPLVKKQLHQTKAIRKLQPELAKIKKQAKGNKQQEGLMMMEVYKKHGINPFRSLGILLVQLPIFIALYRVIQIITTSRERVGEFAYGFMENLAPIASIINNPEAFNATLFGLDLTETAMSPSAFLFAIALLAAFLQYYMAKQTLPTSDSDKRLRDVLAATAEGKEPDQAEVNAIVMRKMLKILPVVLFFVVINLPGALALYFATSNLVAVVQQHRILKRNEDELEEAASKAATKSTAKERAKKAPEAKVTSSKAAPKKSSTAKSKTTKAKASKPASKPVKPSSKTNVTRISAKDTSKSKRR